MLIARWNGLRTSSFAASKIPLSVGLVATTSSVYQRSIYRSISSGNHKLSTSSILASSNIDHNREEFVAQRKGHVKPPSANEDYDIKYLEQVSSRDLFSYCMIGLATSNKFILNSLVRLFPYIPISVMKFFISEIYCGGENPRQVLQTGEKLEKRGIKNMMLSYTIEDSEGVKNLKIDDIINETVDSIDTILIPHMESMIKQTGIENINDIPPGYLALKPSALIENPSYVLKHYQSNPDFDRLVENCSRIIDRIYQSNLKLQEKYPLRKTPFFVGIVDAEKFELQQSCYVLQRSLFKRFNKLDKPVSVVGTIQCYLKQSKEVLMKDCELAKQHGYNVGMKLVRGAYIHSEPNRDEIIYNTKQDTDENYDALIEFSIKSLMNNFENNVGHLVVASHNMQSQVNATDLISKYENSGNSDKKSNIVLGQLLGMADNITYYLNNVRHVKNIIKYVPWGPPLETRDYLQRRLEENGDAVRNDSGLKLVNNCLKVFFKRIF